MVSLLSLPLSLPESKLVGTYSGSNSRNLPHCPYRPYPSRARDVYLHTGSRSAALDSRDHEPVGYSRDGRDNARPHGPRSRSAPETRRRRLPLGTCEHPLPPHKRPSLACCAQRRPVEGGLPLRGVLGGPPTPKRRPPFCGLFDDDGSSTKMLVR